MERRISPMHIVALFITSLIFIVGVLLGWQLGYTAEGQLRSDYEQLTSENYMLEVLSLMKESGEGSCPVLEKSFENFTQSTLEYGNRLEYLEEKLGKLNSEVMQLKSDYSLMQERNYLLVKQLDEDCNVSHVIIVYFYTNENYSRSTDEGIALADALSGLPGIRERTLIYHFDVNVNNPVVDALKEQYSISTLPTMIINGKKYEGFRSADECRGIIASQAGGANQGA